MILFTDLNLEQFYLDDFDDLLDFLLENGTIHKNDFVIVEFDELSKKHYLFSNDDVIGFYVEVDTSKKKIDENLCTSQLNTILQSLNIKEIK